jgi:hypothetical protein
MSRHRRCPVPQAVATPLCALAFTALPIEIGNSYTGETSAMICISRNSIGSWTMRSQAMWSNDR